MTHRLAGIGKLDFSGYVVAAAFTAAVVAILFPPVRWVVSGKQIRPDVSFNRIEEEELPAGYQTLQIPIQPRIEYVRYLAADVPMLDLRGRSPRVPFEIHVEVTDGVATEVTWSLPDPPSLNRYVEDVCSRWTGSLHFAYRFNGKFRVVVYPDKKWRIEWQEINVNSFPRGNAMVCYAVSRYRRWSGYLLPLRGLRMLTKVAVPEDDYGRLAQRCRNQLGLASNEPI